MSYLDRLKALSNSAVAPVISQKHSPQALTELTKAPSVSFVSSPGDTFSEKSGQPTLTQPPAPRPSVTRFFLDRAIPPDTAQALAWLLDSLPHNPHLTQAQRAQAQAALHWLAEEMRICRCAVLFSSSQP